MSQELFFRIDGGWAELLDAQFIEQFLGLAEDQGWTYLRFRSLKLQEIPRGLVRINGLKGLDLASNKELRILPEFIGKLDNLQRLDLSYTGLVELPSVIGKLNSLQDLNLSLTNLAELPEAIGNLTNLQRVVLFGAKRLSNLPEAIGKLISLKNLNLSGSGLTELPKAIGKLRCLHDLNLSDTGLTVLPKAIGSLSSLQSLNLSFARIAELPEVIGELTNLQYLNLSNLDLTELPETIGNLSSLQGLNLSFTKLSLLSESIGHLTNLQDLNLSSSSLAKLPEAVGKLIRLQKLDLSHTRITQLPKAIGELGELRRLDLSDTHLTQLPDSLRSLDKLNRLGVTNLPLGLPPEIYTPMVAQRILDFYFEKDKCPLNEAKLIVLGQGGVGKTSLVNRLLDNTFDDAGKKTEGINIKYWQMPISREVVRLNVWDFGGQEVMHATHQFFLTKRSMYILVWDARQEDDAGRLAYWLELIRSYGGDSPVLVVMNKSDMGAAVGIDEAALVRRYQQNIRDRGHFFSVSCKTGQGIEALKLKINRLLVTLDHVRDKWPAAWFKIKNELEKRQENTRYISYEQYVNIANDNGVVEQGCQCNLIDFLHDLGIVLCFRKDKQLHNNAVLDPRWVTEGVYAVINSELVKEYDGEFEKKELPAILDSTRYPLNDQMYILDMMKKFELCFELGNGRYLIPELLSQEEPKELHADIDDSFLYTCTYNVLPGSVISRFIVRTHRYIEGEARWRNGVALIFEKLHARCVARADRAGRRIDIFVQSLDPSGGGLQAALGVVLWHLHAINKSIGSLKVKGKIPLSVAPGGKIFLDHSHLHIMYLKGLTHYIPEDYTELVEVKPNLEKVEISSWAEAKLLLELAKGDNDADVEGGLICAERFQLASDDEILLEERVLGHNGINQANTPMVDATLLDTDVALSPPWPDLPYTPTFLCKTYK